jgi:hypothetical protein
MPLVAKRKNVEYVNPDPGLYIAVCADIEGPITVPGYKPEDPDKEVIVIWWLLNRDNPKTGKPFEVQRRFNFSMFAGKKGTGGSSLFQVVKSWLGTGLTQEEADELDLEVLLGESCQLQVIEHHTPDGKVFANVGAVLPLAGGQTPIKVPEGYTRRKDRT